MKSFTRTPAQPGPAPTTSHPPLLAYACLALSMALVGAYVALSRPLVAVVPVFVLAWLRFGIAALAMPHWLRKPPSEPALTPTTHGWLFLLSLIGNFLFSIFMLLGMQRSDAITAGIVMASIPAAVAVLGRLVLGDRMPWRTWLAVVMAVSGIAAAQFAQSMPSTLGTSPDPTTHWTSASGPLLLLAAVLCEAAYVIIGKKLLAHLDARRVSALINLWGFVLMTPLGLTQALTFDFTRLTPGLWGLLLFYALAASVWSVWLWMTGLRFIPAAQSGVFTVFLPISAALTGVLALGESINGAQLAAFALALAGVLLATRPSASST